jgi:PBP1b-binding outer membrane lipoprotein LpoB
MRPLILASLLLLPMLSACSGETAGDKKVSQTKMNDIDSLEGTINDDIINTDQTTEEAPLEASAPASPTASAAPKKEAAKPSALAKPEPKLAAPAPAVPTDPAPVE